MKRQVIETLERRKESMIAALWSNDGLNDDKGTRSDAIQELEDNFAEALDMILTGKSREAEIDKENPFFQAMEKGMAKIHGPSGADDATVQAVVQQQEDFHRFIDQ